ncbi:MAG TPA: radical SAM protein [Anaeromyxobacter sp.]|nr:radical SAM protein [Anaeromyxobacter sp.]
MAGPPEAVDLGATESVCPVCLERIPARRLGCGQDVYLSKACPHHGSFRVVVWRGPPSWEAWAAQAPAAARVEPFPPGQGKGCPFECGPCERHRNPTCCALLELTEGCDLRCPYCFAAAGRRRNDPDLAAVERFYRALAAGGGRPNVQLSGGEPTLRDDLPEILALGRSLGFSFFQLNTNGLRLARDGAYASRLAQAGLSCVFLQFDGVTDEAHRRIRGRPLRVIKEAAIARCEELGLGVILVPTVVPGVNTAELGAIVAFAAGRGEVVRGVHLQPVSYFGRFPRPPTDADRITLPELLRALEVQTGGAVRSEHFRPPAAENAHCSFHGEFLRGRAGELRPRPPRPAAARGCCADPAGGDEVRRARDYVARRWSHPGGGAAGGGCCGGSTDALDRVIAEAGRAAFAISGMAFQDAWSLDLDRLRDCFIRVVSPDARAVPFCAYNLTGATGASLHRRAAP